MLFNNKKRTFKRGGVHPPEMKLTSDFPIKDITLPTTVTLSTAQSIGKPSKPIVGKGQHVTRGEKVAEASGFISSNVHTPISGTVKSVEMKTGTDGHPQECILIEASPDDHIIDLQSIADAHPLLGVKDAFSMESSKIVSAISKAGIVGLGGATFPTAVKLAPPKTGNHAEYILINGSECEPYLTCDERLMREMSREVVIGTALLMKACGANKAIIGIEDNKLEAIKAMTREARSIQHEIAEMTRAGAGSIPVMSIEVVTMKTKYPEGGEKMLTETLTGRRIAPGQLPITQGVIIQNVATALAVYHAVIWGIPLIERVMTVSGKFFAAKGNYRVPVGTSLKYLIEQIGGKNDSATESETETATEATDNTDTNHKDDATEPIKIVAGGTMMGRSIADIDGFTTKGMSGLLFLSAEETSIDEPQPCVRCGRCVDSCPMGLQPYLIARLVEIGDIDAAKENRLMDCMECGCCSFSCIAKRRLVEWIKVGKMKSRQ